ncbi:hypothetical protein [Bacillus sp. FJAT-26390]|uniref:hypothetical protein n=1 Tax=Bacillus sp. FJAT-26390 TaxID=1743142 RepID=UPI00159ECBA2|nr:hypothetical protein [Bacillus sp. FJAT-26390]
MMAGKSVYFTEFELEMIAHAFDPFNRSFTNSEDEDKRLEAADNILRKVSE